MTLKKGFGCDEHYETYKKLTKGELFYTALSFYQLRNELHPTDMEKFKKFCKAEMKNWKGIEEED